VTERLAGSDVFPPVSRYTYFDAASVGLMHKGAAAAINAWQQALADDGTVAFDEQAEVEVLDNLNRAAARLFNAGLDDIAVASSESVLMSSLAWAVMPGRGSNIVSARVTHPSTIYPWLRVAEHTGAQVRWADPVGLYTDPETLLALIDDKTSVVCLSHAEYSTGQVYDLKRFADAAHSHGAIVVVDTTQSAGQVPIDVAATGIDAAATSTYKWLCGPFGTGFMYVSPSLQTLNPGVTGWRTNADMWDFQADRCVMPDNAKRYEFGTMAYGAALGTTVAVEFLNDLSVERIAAHNRVIADRLIDGLVTLGAEILSPANAHERSATVAARFRGLNSADVARALKERNVVVSLRGDFLRLSPHFYNGSADIDTALDIISSVANVR
jgi:cysteine desulfurase/selenocysteine lyase